MTTTNDEARRAQIKPISETSFSALAKRDVSSVPWHEDIVLLSPLAPEDLNVLLRGKAAVIQWFESLYPVLSESRMIEHYFSEDLTVIATRADVGITDPPWFLRVVDCLSVTADGRITQKENHYDPSRQSTSRRSGFAAAFFSNACRLTLAIIDKIQLTGSHVSL
jgi:SnoaL-like domain